MKCPMKMREHHVDGHTAECDSDCAWLLDNGCFTISSAGYRRVCAVAVIAEQLCKPEPYCITNAMWRDE